MLEEKKELLLDEVEESLKQEVSERELFHIRWRLR